MRIIILIAIAAAAYAAPETSVVPEEDFASVNAEATLETDLSGIFDPENNLVKVHTTRMLNEIATNKQIHRELELWADQYEAPTPKEAPKEAPKEELVQAGQKAGWHRWRPHAHIPHRYRPHLHVPHRYNPVRAIRRTWNAVKRVGSNVGRLIRRGAEGVRRAAQQVVEAAKKVGQWALRKLREFAGKVCRKAIAKIFGKVIKYFFKRALRICFRLCSRVGLYIVGLGAGNPGNVVAGSLVTAGCTVACKLAANALKRVMAAHSLTAACLSQWICKKLGLPGPNCTPGRYVGYGGGRGRRRRPRRRYRRRRRL